MQEIKAIETEYAGCRFRSRLEARWAVFFDALGVTWLYEPQGYVLGNGESYLPDFWLPDLQLWAEVKGVPSEAEWMKLFAATSADGLPLIYEREPTPLAALGKRDLGRIPTLRRVLLLGEIPRSTYGWGHIVTVLTAKGPGIHQAFFWSNKSLIQIGEDRGWPSTEGMSQPAMISGFECHTVILSNRVANAYDAARKARFEHGERG